MADTIITTARGTGNITSNRIVIDMSKDIAMLKPKAFPLTTIMKRIRDASPVHNYKFEWMEDGYMARWTAINAAAGYAVDATEIVVDDSSIIAVGDLIKDTTTSEVMRVTAITAASHTLTVVRGYGATEAAAIADNEKILVIGNASMQGSGSPAEKYNSVTAVYNYTQIFKTAFSTTNTLNAMKLYGGDELSRLREKKGIEHGLSMEYALLFGERKLDTTGGQPLSTTGGIFKFLSGTTNVSSTASSGTIAQKKAALDSWIEGLFAYGSDTKTWFCSPGVITELNGIAQDKLQLIQADKDSTFGLNITKWLTPHGVLNIVLHPLLAEGYANYSVALDLENLELRPLIGRDTKLETNIQNNDEDGQRDQYLTEAGLQLKLPKTHGIFSFT